MTSAEEAILRALREASGAARRVAEPERPLEPLPGPPPQLEEPGERVTRFAAAVEECGGHCHRAADEAAAAECLASIARGLGDPDLALSDAPLVRRGAARRAGRASFDGWRDRPRLLEAEMGITGAQLGIAESGTLVLFSSSEHHRLTSLLPPVHVVLLREQDLVPDLGTALRAAHELEGGPPPLMTWITGPSRTADIELTLVVGVHGPRELNVVLVE